MNGKTLRAKPGTIVHFRTTRGCQAAIVVLVRKENRRNISVFKTGDEAKAKDKPVFLAPNTDYGTEEKHWHFTNECELPQSK